MTKVALLANPDSGSGEADDAGELLRHLGADVVVFDSDAVEEATQDAPDLLAVAGGDGSIAPAARAAARAGISLAVIPTGTANDFARALEIPDDVEEACRLALERRNERRIDIGLMGDRPFLNVASAGLPPAAAERASGLKSALGPFAYAVGAVRAGATASPVHCEVRCDGSPLFAGEAWQVTVACTGSFGGGSSVDADPGDGRLDVLVIEAGSRLRLARHAYGLRAGRVESQPGTVNSRCARVELEVADGTAFNVDGEVVKSGRATFTVEHEAVRVVVP